MKNGEKRVWVSYLAKVVTRSVSDPLHIPTPPSSSPSFRGNKNTKGRPHLVRQGDSVRSEQAAV